MKVASTAASIGVVALAAWLGGDQTSLAGTRRLPHVGTAGGEVVSAAADTVRWLSDANILQLVEQRQLAPERAAQVQMQSASSDTTMNLALLVGRDHAALRVAVESLATKLHITLSRPALADSVAVSDDVQVAQLFGLASASLERRFVETQAVAHQQALREYEAMAAVATEPDARAFLATRAVQLEQRHLALLRQRSGELAAADSVARAKRGGRGS